MTGRCVCAAVLGNLTHLCSTTGTAQCSLLIFTVLTIVYWTLHYTVQMLPPHLTIVVNDTLVFYLNEYSIELNQAKLKFLNQFLNLIFQENKLLNNFLN